MTGSPNAYQAVFDASIADPSGFWAEAAKAVTWTRPPQRILDDSHPPFYRWFPDAELNTCANALDRHVESGRGEQPALIYDSPVAGAKRTYTYRDLLAETARFAGVLRGLGVDKGDRVVIYMPMIPEAVIAMLACARLGAVHSVVFGGFAAHELAARIDDALPCGRGFGVLRYRADPHHRVQADARRSARHRRTPHARLRHRATRRHAVHPDPRPRRRLGRGDGERTNPSSPSPWRRPTRSTCCTRQARPAKPKGIVRDNGGHAVALMWTMRNVYDTQPGDVYLGRFGCRLGGRPLLHRVRAAAARRDDRALRGQARRDARPGSLLARRRRLRGEGTLHRTDRDTRHQEGGSRRHVPGQVRPVRTSIPVPGRRAPRSRHLPLGGGEDSAYP